MCIPRQVEERLLNVAWWTHLQRRCCTKNLFVTALLTWSWHRGNQLVCKYLLFSWKKCNTSWKRRPFVLKVKVVQTKQVTNGLRFHFALFAVSLPISEQFVRVCAQAGAVHAKMTKAIGKMLVLQPCIHFCNQSDFKQTPATAHRLHTLSLWPVVARGHWPVSWPMRIGKLHLHTNFPAAGSSLQ